MPGTSAVAPQLAPQRLAPQRGHRHFLLITAADGGDIQDRRVAAMRQALQNNGLDAEQYLWLSDIWMGGLSPDSHLKTVESTKAHPLVKYLEKHPQITAIVTANDPTALRVWHVLEQSGRRVPHDMSLVGFDDTDAKLDQFGRNSLTSVRLPLVRVGEEAAKLLLARIGGQDDPPAQIILPTTLMVRHSTAPPRELVAAN